MDYDYEPVGPPGKTCAECVNFRPNLGESHTGICFGRKVCAEGTCRFFKEKD